MAVKIQNNGGFIDDTVKIIGSGTLIVGKNAEIRAYSVIEMGSGRVEIGERSVLGYHTMIQATGELKIGKGSLLGPHCVFIASAHPVNDKPLIAQGLVRGKISIGNNVWFGANCTINTDISIADNAIIGANSFVNRSVPTNQIWAGSPIKYIKER